MSGLTFTVESDLSGLERSLGDAGLKRAQRSLTERVMQDMKDFMPEKTGTLKDEATMSGDDEVSYPTYYAGYVYYNHGRPEYIRPTKGGYPRWEQHAEQAKMGEWCGHVARLLGGKG